MHILYQQYKKNWLQLQQNYTYAGQYKPLKDLMANGLLVTTRNTEELLEIFAMTEMMNELSYSSNSL